MSVVPIDPAEAVLAHSAVQRRPWLALLGRALKLWRTRIGLLLIVILVGIALIGPFFAPHPPTDFVGGTYGPRTADARLGTDYLGQDVLSRFLWGGRSVLWLAFAATLIGLSTGILIGLLAAYSRGLLDDVLMRAMDVILAFPQIVLALVAIATVGPKLWLVVLLVGLTHTPRVARVTRAAALQVVERDFIRSAEAMGDSRLRIMFGDLLPNITSPLLVEAGLRLTYSIGLIAALSFLGFGLQPPAADWGLMINENRQGLTLAPWGVIAPIVALALLTIGTNLVADGLSRALIGIDRGKD
jgi:peptide/nickel transport system permease protein